MYLTNSTCMVLYRVQGIVFVDSPAIVNDKFEARMALSTWISDVE